MRAPLPPKRKTGRCRPCSAAWRSGTLQDEADRANDAAEFWRETAFGLQQQIMEAGGTVGITKDGAIGIISSAAPKDDAGIGVILSTGAADFLSPETAGRRFWPVQSVEEQSA